MHLGRNVVDIALCSQFVKWHNFVLPPANAVHFDHLIKVVFVRLLRHEGTHPPFVVSVLWGGALLLCENFIPHQTFNLLTFSLLLVWTYSFQLCLMTLLSFTLLKLSWKVSWSPSSCFWVPSTSPPPPAPWVFLHIWALVLSLPQLEDQLLLQETLLPFGEGTWPWVCSLLWRCHCPLTPGYSPLAHLGPDCPHRQTPYQALDHVEGPVPSSGLPFQIHVE